MTPKIGQTEDGYSFIGGDPAKQESWKQVGTIEDGHEFIGGDPSQQTSWKPVEAKAEVETPASSGTAMDSAEAALRGIGKGASFGFADELSGVVNVGVDTMAGLANKINPEWGYEDDKNIGESYREGRDYARKDYEELAKKAPIASTVGEIGGAIGTGLVGGTGRLLTRAALEGGAYGLGESEAEDLKGMAVDTAKGAGLGLGTAGVMKGAGKLINTKKVAEKGAGRLLETTPVDRAKLANKGVNLAEGGTSNVMESLPDYLKKKGFTGNLDQLSIKVKESSKKAGETIGKIAKDYDEYISEATAHLKGKPFGETFEQIKKNISYDFNKVADDLEKEVLENIKGVPGYKNEVATITNYIKELRETGVVESLEKLNTIRRGIDDKIKWDKLNPSIMDDVQSTVRKDINKHIKDTLLPAYDEMVRVGQMVRNPETGKLVMKSNPPSALKQLIEANQEYTMASSVQDLLVKAPGRKANRRAVGLTDSMWGLGGIGTAIATGSPLPLLAPIGKKALDTVAPKAMLYAPEIGKAASKVIAPTTRAITQQGASMMGEKDQDKELSPSKKLKGTQYEQVFTGDSQEDAVKHKILMSKDPNYKKMYMGEEEETRE
jgi:hypothetical protein